VRAAGLAGLFAACLVALPSLRRPRGSLNAARALVGQGGWMTLATLAGGILGYADRFIVGALVPVAAFTYYATPQEAISRIIVIPVAFSGVVFPKVSADWGGRPDRVRLVVASAVAALTVMMAPAAMAAGVFAPELMRAWLGPVIGPETVGVTRWFLFGIVVNGLATLPFVLLQAVGRARTTGLLQLAELVPFVLALYWAVTWFGIGGAAVVWVARIVIDCALLFAAARRALAPVGGLPARPVLLLTPVAAGFALGALLDGIAARFAVLALASALTTWAAWHVSGDEARAEFLTRLRRVVSRGGQP
jgi:O-antigen/teichoic acid export membrane protein